MGVVETVSPGSYKIFFVVRNLTLCHWLIIFLNIIFSVEARVCIWYIGFRLLDWQRQSPRPHSKRWELNYDLAIRHWHCYRNFFCLATSCVRLGSASAHLRSSVHVFYLFFFFFFLPTFVDFGRQYLLLWTVYTLFTYCAYAIYVLKNIKNGSQDTIYTFKNYFVTVFSVFNNNYFVITLHLRSAKIRAIMTISRVTLSTASLMPISNISGL